MTDTPVDEQSTLTIIVESGGKTYRKGPWKIIQTTLQPNLRSLNRELAYLSVKFTRELGREIEFELEKKNAKRPSKV